MSTTSPETENVQDKNKSDKQGLWGILGSFSAKLYGLITGISLILILGYIVSQILAIGFTPAWNKYNKDWLIAIIAALVFGGVFVLAFWIFFGVASMIEKLPPRIEKWVMRSISTIFVTSVFIFFLATTGYKEARDDYYKFPDINSSEGLDVAESVKKQSESLKGLSGQATELLSQLEATEVLIQDNKKRLTSTLTDIAKQVNSVEEANKHMASLVERQKQIELRASELERILDGKAPITRDDLNNASKWGWIQGVGTSIIAAFMIMVGNIIIKRLRKKGNTLDPPSIITT